MMNNRLKANKTTILVINLVAVSVFLLSSCTTSALCLSGLCPSAEEHIKRIPWEPPSLNHQNCPNISGKYKTGIYKSTDYSNYLPSQFPAVSNRLSSLRVDQELLRQIPQTLVSAPTKQNPDRTVLVDDTLFYEEAHILIQQNEQQLVLLLIGQNGKLYRRRTIDLNSPMTGCDHKDFIIRTVSIAGGADFTSTSAHTTEIRSRKLADGQLQVTTSWKNWNYDNAFGLDISKPWNERKVTKIFPSIP